MRRSSPRTDRPLLAFTSGDPAGVGPEVAVAAMSHPAVRRVARLLAIGPRGPLARAGWRPSLAPLLETSPVRPGLPPKPSAEGGRTSYEAVRLALKLASRGLIDGMVTAPISKESWALASVPYRDHTAFLQRETGSPRAAMLLAAGNLRSVIVTRHIPLDQVSRALTEKELRDAVELTEEALRTKLGIRRPHLGLCALNPHAGDGGIIGREEITRLTPWAKRLRAKGLRLDGPIPSDVAWGQHAQGRFDALIALYHDQALIPLKVADRYGVINWTIGVPILRTSPGHGTAFDIAGRRKADPKATVEAALWAARVARP